MWPKVTKVLEWTVVRGGGGGGGDPLDSPLDALLVVCREMMVS